VQRRTAVGAQPGTAPTASRASLRIDEINSKFGSVAEGVDDSPGSRSTRPSAREELAHDSVLKDTATPAPNGAGVRIW
jgi:hypothetical protein